MRSMTCGHCGTDLGEYAGTGRPLTRCGPCHRRLNTEYARTYRASKPKKPKPAHQRSRGYRGVYRPGHSTASTTGYAAEHRYVMYEHLGRAPLPGETVHHKNGDRTDNRIENLELRASHHGPGQRVEDIVEWATMMLQRYAPQRLRDNPTDLT